MRRFRTRFGLVTTREALIRYPRIHLVGRRAVEVIWSGSGRVPSVDEQLTFEPRQRLGTANKDAAWQAGSTAPACRRAS